MKWAFVVAVGLSLLSFGYSHKTKQAATVLKCSVYLDEPVSPVSPRLIQFELSGTEGKIESLSGEDGQVRFMSSNGALSVYHVKKGSYCTILK